MSMLASGQLDETAGEVVAHQFDDAGQQRHAVELGMWVFVATEVLVFGVLMTAYVVMRGAYGAAFAEAGGHLYKWLGVTNAVVLVASSGAMAMGVVRAREAGAGARGAARWMALTVGLGLVFVAVKGVEYTLDVREGLVPGAGFDAGAFSDPRHAAMFFLFYWVMTGLHAVHVIAGISVIGAMAARVKWGPGSAVMSNSVHAVGLYWHFVDIVWIFLLPLLYLNP